MRLAEFAKPIVENDGVYQENKVWIIPVRVLGTMKVYTDHEPHEAWVELDKGGHIIADAASDIAFEELERGQWLAMCECFGTVVLSGLPSLNAAKDVIAFMTPLLWTSGGYGFLEKPKVEVCGSITSVDIDKETIFKLVRNYASGEFEDDADSYVEL